MEQKPIRNGRLFFVALKENLQIDVIYRSNQSRAFSLPSSMKLTAILFISFLAKMTCYGYDGYFLSRDTTEHALPINRIDQIHPTIQTIFCGLPLDKSRLELREMILKDKRFVLTDTTFNNFPPSTFFKGLTTDKGLIEAKPDSIQVMLIYGNAALVTEKGGQEDTTKHPMILEYQYFFSHKESAKLEYRRILNLVQRIFTDTSSIMDDNWETDYATGQQNGIQKCSGKIFDSYEPYYRVAISMISYTPSDDAQPFFVLDIALSKEDK